MTKHLKFVVQSLIVLLVVCSWVSAQPPQSPSASPNAKWRFNPKDNAIGDGGPAPKRDLTGTWAGPGSSPAVPRGEPAEKPSLTPLGQQLMSQIGRASCR